MNFSGKEKKTELYFFEKEHKSIMFGSIKNSTEVAVNLLFQKNKNGRQKF